MFWPNLLHEMISTFSMENGVVLAIYSQLVGNNLRLLIHKYFTEHGFNEDFVLLYIIIRQFNTIIVANELFLSI